MSESSETIFSIARENRALRWAVILLTFATAVLAVALAWRPAAPIWVISSNGEIHRGEKQIVSWEPLEASRRALEILFVPTEKRTDLIDAFYADTLRGSAKGHDPKDRFIAFQIKKLTPGGPGKVTVDGVLQRVDKPPVSMTLLLEQAPRSELNPFGLVVAQGTFDEAVK